MNFCNPLQSFSPISKLLHVTPPLKSHPPLPFFPFCFCFIFQTLTSFCVPAFTAQLRLTLKTPIDHSMCYPLQEVTLLFLGCYVLLLFSLPAPSPSCVRAQKIRTLTVRSIHILHPRTAFIHHCLFHSPFSLGANWGERRGGDRPFCISCECNELRWLKRKKGGNQENWKAGKKKAKLARLCVFVFALYEQMSGEKSQAQSVDELQNPITFTSCNFLSVPVRGNTHAHVCFSFIYANL